MPRGRSARLQSLVDLPLGEVLVISAEDGETVEALMKKLRQVTTLYLREGRAYRLKMLEGGVEATRVPVGTHKKMGHLFDLKTGERHFVARDLEWKDRKSLLAKVERFRMNSSGNYWEAEIDGEGIWIRRTMTNGVDEDPWPKGTNCPMPKWLTLARD